MSRYLGIDPGDARVGVAISDELNFLAHPLETIVVRRTPVVKRIVALVVEKKITTVVVGMPRNMDGSYGPAAQKTKELIAALKTAVACEVIPWDERMTTLSAQRGLHEAGRNAKQQRAVIDQAAARVILQSWMDSQTGGILP